MELFTMEKKIGVVAIEFEGRDEIGSFAPRFHEIANLKANGKAVSLGQAGGKPALIFVVDKDRPMLGGKPVTGLSLTAEEEKKILDAGKQHLTSKKAEATRSVIATATVVAHGYSWSVEAKDIKNSKLREDIHDFEETLCSVKTAFDLQGKLKPYISTIEEGDYNTWYEWRIPYSELEKIIGEAKKVIDALKQAEREKEKESAKKEIENIRSYPLEKIAQKYFTEQIHVDEDGKFSSCEDFCDDCFFQQVWKKDVEGAVRQASSPLEVEGKYGKIYTYRRADEKSLAVFVSDFPALLEERRGKELQKLAEILKV